MFLRCSNLCLQAAQGSEPELLIPISVVVTEAAPDENIRDTPFAPQTATGTIEPQLLLCGDPNQLGAIVTSERARAGELDVSLLERLFERPVYSDHTQARSKLNFRSSADISKPARFASFTNLVKVVALSQNQVAAYF